MLNNYFGKFEHSFILYIDPVQFDIINLSKHFTSVSCNEIIFSNSEDNLQNASFDVHVFTEILKNKTISEFDVIFDDGLHVQNIWWDDLLVISPLNKLDIVLNLLKPSIPLEEQSKLDICIETPNYYFSFNNKISKQEVSPISFQNFIKDAVHYQDKAKKFI